MRKSSRRLAVVHGHLNNTKPLSCSASAVNQPTLTISPATCQIDEKIHIQVDGLAAYQTVTLTSQVEEGGRRFEARGVYKTNKDGSIDNTKDSSLAGTFTGVEPMGLFWSIAPSHGQNRFVRLIKKDVTTPMVFTVSVYNGLHTDASDISENPLTSATVQRLYKHPNVRKILVTEGPYRGAIFIPEGKGPFPGLIDAYGGLITLVETRAALLATHGYATFTISYFYEENQMERYEEGFPNHFKAALEWFSQQDYVDEERLGAVGLCFGGFLMLTTAAICPKIKALVNINGTPIMPESLLHTVQPDRTTPEYTAHWTKPENVYATEEGLISREAFNCKDPACIPAWRYGAKILTIVGEDDQQVHPRWHTFALDGCPPRYRANMEMASYPGAGHLIEPPYSPLCRAMTPGPSKMAMLGIAEEHTGRPFINGGNVVQHARAQEEAWHRTLDFLNKNLKQLDTRTGTEQSGHT